MRPFLYRRQVHVMSWLAVALAVPLLMVILLVVPSLLHIWQETQSLAQAGPLLPEHAGPGRVPGAQAGWPGIQVAGLASIGWSGVVARDIGCSRVGGGRPAASAMAGRMSAAAAPTPSSARRDGSLSDDAVMNLCRLLRQGVAPAWGAIDAAAGNAAIGALGVRRKRTDDSRRRHFST